MPDLKLAKLPDRTPVKIGISVNPELHAALNAYADAYQAIYGDTESVAELIPYMLNAFIQGDAGFRKALRERDAAPSGITQRPPKPRRIKMPAVPAIVLESKDSN